MLFIEMKQIFKIIGISDNPGQELTGAAETAIASGKAFSGGKRHYELMHERLPEGARWMYSFVVSGLLIIHKSLTARRNF